MVRALRIGRFGYLSLVRGHLTVSRAFSARLAWWASLSSAPSPRGIGVTGDVPYEGDHPDRRGFLGARPNSSHLGDFSPLRRRDDPLAHGGARLALECCRFRASQRRVGREVAIGTEAVRVKVAALESSFAVRERHKRLCLVGPECREHPASMALASTTVPKLPVRTAAEAVEAASLTPSNRLFIK
jgi:hypothetical protein